MTDKKKEEGVSLVDLKKIRLRGKFSQQNLSTCPSLPKLHATYGEPTEVQPDYVEADHLKSDDPIERESLKFLNRVDHIEIDEVTQEVFVHDDFKIYIMYECALSDMQMLENELLRVGSYYISKLEELFDSEVDRVVHTKDRQQVLSDLLAFEVDFQFKKVKLTELYLQCYEHVCDPVEQQRLMQIITDTMARRPRLALEALYFKDSYKAELACLDQNIELLQTVIANQKALEK